MESVDKRRIRRRRAVGCGVVFGALLIAVPALGAGLKTRSQSETFDVGLGTATAECKQGEKVISGGFANPGFNPDNFAGPQIRTYESFKQGTGEWTVSGANVSSFEGTLTAYAYCREGKGLKTKSMSVEVEPFPGAESVRVSCGKGRKVVSGGSMSPGYDYKGFTGSVHPYESRKQGPRKWIVSGNNRGLGDDPGTLTAYAYCRKGKGLKTKAKSTEIQPGATGTATAKCKRGQKVVSGGYDAPDFDPVGSVIRVYESRKRGGRKWSVSALAFEPGTLTAYAYCEKKRK